MKNSFAQGVYSAAPLWLQDVMVSLAGRKLCQQRYNNAIFEGAVDFLEQSAEFSKAEMDEYREEQLQALIQHSYDTVPYYKQLFSEVGLTPDDIKHPEDLRLLPVLTKEMVRMNKDKMLSSNDPFATFNSRMVVPINESEPPFWRYNRVLDQMLFSIYHMNEDTLLMAKLKWA
jgi:phenylacetate-CoA ligase